ncbi:MAG: DNA ligase D [Acidimicrobiia bacterium]
MSPKNDRLAEYRRKRDPDATPEPFGDAVSDGPRRFVVQKHAASRLHYDLRLESDGVLLSWAIPKGPSLDPTVKRFAARTEDHPLAYADFEGVIPDGEYGAGTMIVWDHGPMTFIDGKGHGLDHGKLLFDLHGYKLRGRFTLVRTARGSDEWLLIKKPDRWATDQQDFDETSTLSGRSLDDVATGVSGGDTVRDSLARWGAPVKEPHGGVFEPMLAEVANEPFSDPNWVFEIKYDGYRLVAHKSEHLVLLHYRSGLDATQTFPEIAAAVGALPVRSAVIDGEVVVLDDDGLPSFAALQRRGRLTNRHDVAAAASRHRATYFVFDLPRFEDWDLTPLPLTQRKEALKLIVPTSGPIRFADHVVGRGVDLYHRATSMHLEGVMAKRADSPYRNGRSSDWLKLRIQRSGLFAVIGMTRSNSGDMGALHLAAHRDGSLAYAGRVGSGFSQQQRTEIVRSIEAAEPLATHIPDLPDDAASAWVEPVLAAEVRYTEVTGSGVLRQPVFVRMHSDSALSDIADLSSGRSARIDADPDTDPNGSVPVPQAAMTNREKVFWPDSGHTKGDLLDYYDRVADHLLPYLADRPLVTVRYPDGIEGKSFYQKSAPDFAPDWIRTEWIGSSDDERGNNYFVCESRDALRYIVNLGAIPLHIWASRVATIGRPDWCVLDLDPKRAPFSAVVAIARAIKDLTDSIALPSCVKTSGQSGLHVLIPMGAAYGYEQQRLLGELIARIIENEHDTIATTTRNPAARGDRVYIDHVQNGRGKLIAAPYAVRPVPGATVSMPLRWAEVTPTLDPARFTIKSAVRRLAQMRDDPLRPVLTETPDLATALSALAALVEKPQSVRRDR